MIAKFSTRTQTAGVRVASRALPTLPRHSMLARAGPEVRVTEAGEWAAMSLFVCKNF